MIRTGVISDELWARIGPVLPSDAVGAVPTRYDKYACTYAGGVLLAATVMLARP